MATELLPTVRLKTMNRIRLNRETMESLRSEKGGYTKALTDALGVPYPLEKGWKTGIEFSGRTVTQEEYDKLLILKDIKCEKKKRGRT